MLAATSDPALLPIPGKALQLRIVGYSDLLAAKPAQAIESGQSGICNLDVAVLRAYLKYENMISQNHAPAGTLSVALN